MKKNALYVLSAAAIFATGMLLNSCKEPADTLAKILIKDVEGFSVSGATVALYGEPSEQGVESTVADTTESNAAGEAIFNLNDLYKKGQAGVAVLNISATKDSLSGSGVIKIEEETTNTETIFVQP